jgi:hypothetical protein
VYDLCIFFRHRVVCEHQFCLKLGVTAAEAHKMLEIIYGHDAVSCMYVLK